MSNADVLGRAHQMQYSSMFQKRQVQLFQKIQLMPVDSMLRKLVCNSSGDQKTWHAHRGRGRPRQRWTESVYKLVLQDLEHSLMHI